MYDQFDISALVAEWGQVYTDNGQTAKDIKVQLFAEDDFSKYFKMKPWKSDMYTSAYATIDDVLQAFSIPFTHKGNSIFKPWQQRLGEFKIDTGVTPDKFRASWTGFWVELEKAERKKWSFINWLLQKKLIPKAKENFLKQVAYYGWKITEYDVAETITASGAFPRQFSADDIPQPANGSMDGVRLQIAKMIDAGRITPYVVPGGAWSTDPVTFYNQVEAWIKLGVSDELRDQLDHLFMTSTFYNRFREGKRAKFNMHWEQEGLYNIEDTDITIVKTQAQTGSEQIWATPAENRVRPTRLDQKNRFDIQGVDRNVKILGDWSYLLTFDVPELIITSDIGSNITLGEIAARYAE